MGPQLCSCGNIPTSGSFRVSPWRLQWGRNFAVAETWGATFWAIMFATLQWGRNFAVAETDTYLKLASTLKIASMGPQLCSCGNVNASKYVRRSTSLQWGRNFAVAETGFFRRHMHLDRMLQWGRNFAVAETRRKGRKGRKGRSFNGAATLQLRKRLYGERGDHSMDRFNGAATLQLRKLELID